MIPKRIAKSTFRKFGSVLAVLFLLFASFALLDFPKRAYGCGNNITCTNTNIDYQAFDGGAGATSISTNAGANFLTVYGGDLMVVMAGNTVTTTAVSGVTDTQGTAYTLQKKVIANYELEIWTGVVPSGCSNCADTITITYTAGTSSSFAFVDEFRGVANMTLSTHQGTSSAGNGIEQVDSYGAPPGSFNIALMVQGGDPGALTTQGLWAKFVNHGFQAAGGATCFSVCRWAASWFYVSSGPNPPTNNVMTTGNSVAWDALSIVFTPQTSGSSTGNLGVCGPKDTSVTTMANNTMYYYIFQVAGPGTVSNLTARIAKITSSTATETVTMAVYAQAAPGTISASDPLVLQTTGAFGYAAGSKNIKATFNPGVGANAGGDFIAIGIVGNNKVNINQSSLVLQMYSVAAAAATPPNQIVSTATIAGNIQLCGTYTFGVIVTSTTTITATTTSTFTTTGVFTSTVTSTVSTVSVTFLSSTSNWPIVFLLLFMPMGLLLGVTKNLTGALLGLTIGAVICLGAGLIPNFIFIGLVIAIVGCAFVVSRTSGGGGRGGG